MSEEIKKNEISDAELEQVSGSRGDDPEGVIPSSLQDNPNSSFIKSTSILFHS